MEEFDFDHNGMKFRCIVSQDEFMGTPWTEHDGHGEIREAYQYYGKPEKKPGEVIIYSERGDYWIYDFAGAVRKAKKDGWGSADCTPEMSKGQRAETAARADMKYCREWLQGDRWWACIEVFRVDADGEKIGESEYLGGIDSGYSKEDESYLRECATELATGIHAQALGAWRSALKEARQRKYWACRDIETVGA